MKGSEVQGQPELHSQAMSQHAPFLKAAYYIFKILSRFLRAAFVL